MKGVWTGSWERYSCETETREKRSSRSSESEGSWERLRRVRGVFWFAFAGSDSGGVVQYHSW